MSCVYDKIDFSSTLSVTCSADVISRCLECISRFFSCPCLQVDADIAEAEGMMNDGGEVFPPDATVSVEYRVRASAASHGVRVQSARPHAETKRLRALTQA